MTDQKTNRVIKAAYNLLEAWAQDGSPENIANPMNYLFEQLNKLDPIRHRKALLNGIRSVRSQHANEHKA